MQHFKVCRQWIVDFASYDETGSFSTEFVNLADERLQTEELRVEYWVAFYNITD